MTSIKATINISEDIQVTVDFQKFEEVSKEIGNIVEWAKARREEKVEELRKAQSQAQTQHNPIGMMNSSRKQ
jgi:hypothetical protein